MTVDSDGNFNPHAEASKALVATVFTFFILRLMSH